MSLESAYWEQAKELAALRETVAAKDTRISGLEAALADKALPDIAVSDDECRMVHRCLDTLHCELSGRRLHEPPEKAKARLAAICELGTRLMGKPAAFMELT